MFYLGLLVLPCTHTEDPRSPRPVGLFTLNHRIFRPFVRDRRPSSRTVVPRPGPLSLVPDRCPSSRTLVPRPGPSSIVPDPRPSSRTVIPRPRPSSLVPDGRPLFFDPLFIYSKSLLDVLDSYPTLRLSSLCLSIYHIIPCRSKVCTFRTKVCTFRTKVCTFRTKLFFLTKPVCSE